MVNKYTSAKDAIADLDNIRKECASICDKLFVLDSTSAKGVSREILIMSNTTIELIE